MNALKWLWSYHILMGITAIVTLAVFVVLFATGVLDGDSDNSGANASANASVNDNGGSTVNATPTRVSETSSIAMSPDGMTSGNTTAMVVCPGDHVVNSGETYDVPTGCNVKGDVAVADQQLYDDDPTTGLIVSCPHGCTIMAPFGANVTPRTVDDLKTEMLSTGCGSKCVSVKVVVIDAQPAVNVTSQCDVSLPKGVTATVPGGCVISGDVEVNGKALYDSDQTTGLVVIVKSDVTVHAPYGASVTNANPDDVVNAVKQTGCGLPGGCRVVNTVTVP